MEREYKSTDEILDYLEIIPVFDESGGLSFEAYLDGEQVGSFKGEDSEIEVDVKVAEDGLEPLNEADPCTYTGNGLNNVGRLDWLDDLADFSAGMGDTMTFGGTDWIRKQLGSDDVVDKCSGWYKGGEWAGNAWWEALNAAGYEKGPEFKIGKDIRIAPWGNRTGDRLGELPHYHKRTPDPRRPGHGLPGKGIDKHRPWE